MFSKKKAQLRDHQVMDSVQTNESVNTQGPKVTALSQVCIVGNSSKTQSSILPCWLAGENQSQNLFQEETNNKYVATMMRQDISETVHNCSGEIIVSSNPSSQGTVENHPLSILRSTPSMLSAISSTPVTKRLPESRPGLMKKRAGLSNEVESFPCQATQDKIKNVEILSPREGNLKFNLYGNTLVQADISEQNLGVLGTFKDKSQTEQFNKPTQAGALASKKRQVLFLSIEINSK